MVANCSFHTITMKKSTSHYPSVLFFLLLGTLNTRSQGNNSILEKLDFSISLGSFFLLGDLGGNPGTAGDFVKDFNFKSTKLNLSVDANYYVKKWLSIGAGFVHGKLESDDASILNKGGGEIPRIMRNLNSRTTISEFHALLKFYPKWLFNQSNLLRGKFDLYGIGGVGIYHFDPAVQDRDGSWIKASPLKLEGQGFDEYPGTKPYALTQFKLQSGAGVKYSITKNMAIAFEVVYRKLFTDYLDDVSTIYINPMLFDKYLSAENAAIAKRVYYKGIYTDVTNPDTELTIRGDPTDYDAYISENITIVWRFCNSRGKIKCPKF